MPLRICKECGKKEMLRNIKNPSEYCSHCSNKICHKNRLKKRKENGQCLKCGKQLEPKKCPHCNGVLSCKLTCNTCKKKRKSSSINNTNNGGENNE